MQRRTPGEEEELQKTIQEYSDTVYRLAYAMLKNRHDADDIYQEVFLRYLKKQPKFENGDHAKAWFLRVTVNCCKNFWRSPWRKRMEELREESLTVDGIPEPEGELLSFVKALPDKYRLVIHLFYYEELSIEQISRLTGIMPSTVRTQLTRAREKLRKSCGAYFQPEAEVRQGREREEELQEE